MIKNRRRFGRHFSESELWYLLYVLVKVANFYEERADCVGNIHPMNVMMSEGSRIQLFTLHSSPAELENLTRIKTSRHFDVYVGTACRSQPLKRSSSSLKTAWFASTIATITK